MFSIINLIAVMTTLLTSTFAQSSMTTSAPQSTITTSLYFGNGLSTTSQAWGGSVVAAASDRTTFAVNCISACPAGVSGQTITIVEGPAIYFASYFTALQGQQANVAQSCSLAGTTQAACIGSVALNLAGISTSTVVTTTYTSLPYVPVTVTAGVSKLAAVTSGTASRSSASSSGAVAATTTPNAAAGLVGPKTRFGEWLALTVITGGLAVLGGLLVMA